MDPIKTLITRANASSDDTVLNLMILLLGLVLVALISGASLVILRKRRQYKTRVEMLPQYHDVAQSKNHRRLTIQTSHIDEKSGLPRSSVIIYSQSGKPMLANPLSAPSSPDNVPEIHITFPDEHDEQGRPKSGRVLVVRVGETAIGLEPLQDEQLPAYEKESTQFVAIDLEKIGGLKEKEYA
ncbi:hypothetical protein P8C59_000364 [Phyllachora maydis]|uniref:Uncharacterized protein n=1 Tax=Phyllachora maydis TaxID=1825666 RepID=A0AAD9MA77_9PEZI|nr:hypothetical protein P8C59_000364 [Phyllachora maydis]